MAWFLLQDKKSGRLNHIQNRNKLMLRFSKFQKIVLHFCFHWIFSSRSFCTGKSESLPLASFFGIIGSDTGQLGQERVICPVETLPWWRGISPCLSGSQRGHTHSRLIQNFLAQSHQIIINIWIPFSSQCIDPTRCIKAIPERHSWCQWLEASGDLWLGKPSFVVECFCRKEHRENSLLELETLDFQEISLKTI